MKVRLLIIALALVLCACSSNPSVQQDGPFKKYFSYIGQPVPSGYEPIGVNLYGPPSKELGYLGSEWLVFYVEKNKISEVRIHNSYEKNTDFLIWFLGFGNSAHVNGYKCIDERVGFFEFMKEKNHITLEELTIPGSLYYSGRVIFFLGGI